MVIHSFTLAGSYSLRECMDDLTRETDIIEKTIKRTQYSISFLPYLNTLGSMRTIEVSAIPHSPNSIEIPAIQESRAEETAEKILRSLRPS